MGFWNFKTNNSVKSRFIAGWEINFNDSAAFKNFLLTHGINEASMKVFSRLQSSTELVIRGEKVIKTIVHNKQKNVVKEVDYSLPITEWIDRQLFFLHKDNSGSHSIGGQIPDNFVIPSSKKTKSPFIYIGTLDGTDPNFNWLNIEKLHISYPIFEGSFKVFLDYSNPNAPEILNEEVFNYSWVNNEIFDSRAITFNKQTYKSIEIFELEKFGDLNDTDLICGVPLWLQYPSIPVSPKNGKLMQFVTSINSDETILIQNKTGISDLPFGGEHLIFGDCGWLYIFYEPESKVLSLEIQF